MPDPCIQAPTIGRIEEKIDKVMDSLQSLAVQKNDIDHLKTDQVSLRNWVKNHESRMQALELQPGKLAGKIIYMMAGVGTTVLAGLILYIFTAWKG